MVRCRGAVGRRDAVVQIRAVRQIQDALRALQERQFRHNRQWCEWDAWGAGRQRTGLCRALRRECAEDSCQGRSTGGCGRRLVCRAEFLQRRFRYWAGSESQPRVAPCRTDEARSAASPCAGRAARAWATECACGLFRDEREASQAWYPQPLQQLRRQIPAWAERRRLR